VTCTIAYQQIRTPGGKSRQVKVDPATSTSAHPTVSGITFESNAATTNPAWRTRFDALYLLSPGETLKRVRPPWVPERLTFYQVTSSTGQVQAMPMGPDMFLLGQTPTGQLMLQTSTFGGSASVRSMLRDLGVAPHETDLPQAVLRQSLPGDFVVRQDAPTAARVAAFTQLLSEATGRTWRSAVRPLEREVIVVSGTYAYHPPADMPRDASGGDTIHFYLGKPDNKPMGFSGSGGAFGAMFNHLEDVAKRQVIIETKLPSRGANSYRDHASMQPLHGEVADPAAVDALLANVGKQTSFQLKRERRVVPTWVFTPQ
jgi:hypothetical protein